MECQNPLSLTGDRNLPPIFGDLSFLCIRKKILRGDNVESALKGAWCGV